MVARGLKGGSSAQHCAWHIVMMRMMITTGAKLKRKTARDTLLTPAGNPGRLCRGAKLELTNLSQGCVTEGWG
jgi:hypothetical protein